MFTNHLRVAKSRMPRATTNRARTKPACRLCIEPLEDRSLLSVLRGQDQVFFFDVANPLNTCFRHRPMCVIGPTIVIAP